MCSGGGGGGSDKAAEEARRREEERQARIEAGMSQIDAVFSGGTYGRGRIDKDSFDPTGTYYLADGTRFVTPMKTERVRSGGGNIHPGYKPGSEAHAVYGPGLNPHSGEYNSGPRRGGGRYAETEVVDQAAIDKLLASGGLFSDVKTTEGFGDDFYDKRTEAYVDYATPQLQDQYQSASAALTAALSRQGQLRSSLAAKRGADLSKQFGTQQQAIADRGRGYANEARRSVDNARSDAVALLQSSADPDAAVSQALNAASSARASLPSFDPLGPAFQNATAGLAGYQQGTRLGDINNQVNDLYGRGPGAGSGRVVRG